MHVRKRIVLLLILFMAGLSENEVLKFDMYNCKVFYYPNTAQGPDMRCLLKFRNDMPFR